MLLGNAFWNIVVQSDFMTQLILLGLLLLSIACWTAMLLRWIQLRKYQKQLNSLSQSVKKAHDIGQLQIVAAAYADSFVGQIVARQLNDAQRIIQRGYDNNCLSEELMLLDDQRVACIEEIVESQERSFPLLAASAAVAPLIGLFGTVWGLTHSFMSISERQVADIVTIAPGLAEALFTTLAGLMVAIPVSLMYYYLKMQVSQFEFRLIRVSDKVHTIVCTALLERKGGNEVTLQSQKMFN